MEKFTHVNQIFLKRHMKKLIDKFIVQFSYKNPHLWLEINEWVFDEIEDCRKKQKEKMYKNVQELIRKIK